MQVMSFLHREAVYVPPLVFAGLTMRQPAPSRPYRLLRAAVLGLDRLLRRYYGITEFSASPTCLLRIARANVRSRVHLPDGGELEPDDLILELHFWNDQVPRDHGEGLGWAAGFRARLQRSLAELAVQIMVDPAFRDVRALRAETRFVTRGRGRKLARIASHYGFAAPLTDGAGLRPRSPHLGEDLHAFGLALAYNPRSLRRKGLLRERHELWMSRESLLARYGSSAMAPETAQSLDRKAA